jgi:hypothetical protein
VDTRHVRNHPGILDVTHGRCFIRLARCRHAHVADSAWVTVVLPGTAAELRAPFTRGGSDAAGSPAAVGTCQ